MSDRIILISNYINHHQIPLCDALFQETGGKFAFVQTQPMSEERKDMGWELKELPSYVVMAFPDRSQAMKRIDEAEVVIYGGAEDESFIAGRLKEGKKVIRYHERLYREGQWKAVSPRGLYHKFMEHTRYRKKDVSLLCAGAYVPCDFALVFAYPGKMYRFGYFPKFREYESLQTVMDTKKKSRILWVGRFLPLKHPEYAIETARYLKEKGFAFELFMIGGGEMEEVLKEQVRVLNLASCVTFYPFMSPDEVRSLMESAAIFLMTSDKREGWGAVINEAMNSGCPVVADYAIGSVPFLIKHGINGYVYKDKSQLFSYTEELLQHHKKCEQMGRKAYETIRDGWNEKEAARRLVTLCTTGQVPADEGPCSPAPVVMEWNMYSHLMKEQTKR